MKISRCYRYNLSRAILEQTVHKRTKKGNSVLVLSVNR